MKGRKWAIVSKQQKFDGYNKKIGRSPTWSNHGLIVTAVVDAHEQQYTARLNIWGAFLHVTNDEYISSPLQGKIVERLVAPKPELY